MEDEQNSEFLPDLGNEKDCDEAVFELKVKRANEAFMKSMNAVIEWKMSPIHHRKYPSEAKRNKCKYRNRMKKFSYDSKKGILYKQVTGSDNIERMVQVIFDLKRQDSLISACHSGLGDNSLSAACHGHFGRDRMFATLSQRYSMPMLRQRIQYYIKYCKTCQMYGSKKLQKSGVELHSVPIPNRAWYQIGVDLIGPLKECEGKRYVVTCCDYYTKFVEAECIENKTGELVARFLYRLMTRYGIFKICITDQGREFCNELVESLFRLTSIKHKVSSSYHPQTCGLIERVNRSIEDVIRKTMTDQKDWVKLLDSVLFACRVHKHASTGVSPFRMVYNRDAMLPFEYADEQDNNVNGDSDSNNDNNEDINDLSVLLRKMEEHKDKVFATATKNIKKAQAHQAKCYKNRNTNPEFKPGVKVLKKNMKDLSRKEKFKKKFTGPYEVVRKTDKSCYILKDKYSHVLRRPVPAVQLVLFHVKPGKTSFPPDSDSPTKDIDDSENYEKENYTNGDISRDADISDMEEDDNKCGRNRLYTPTKNSGESVPVKSQVIIINSTDSPLSSDDTEIIDVGGPCSDNLSNKKTTVEVEIVDDLYESDSERIEIVDSRVVVPADKVYFNPLGKEDRLQAAKRLHLAISGTHDNLKYTGIGKLLPTNKSPKISLKSTGNGGCLFNSLSILVAGTETYSWLLRHIVCNFIEDTKNLPYLREHIPMRYNNGKHYLKGSGMRASKTWGTDLEIYSFARVVQYDIYVFSRHGNWVRYGHVKDDSQKSPVAFYLDNSSAVHFDPILDA